MNGTATEIFNEYAAYPAGGTVAFPSGAAQLNAIYDADFDAALDADGRIIYSGRGIENSYIVTYDYEGKAAAYDAIESFRAALEAGFDDIEFTVTEKLSGKYLEAVSYDASSTVEARLFTEQEIGGTEVYRIVLAIADAVETPVSSDVEIWLEVDLDGNGETEHTVRINDAANGFGNQIVLTQPAEDDTLGVPAYNQKTLYYQNNARDYLTYDSNTEDEVRENSLSNGTFKLTNLPFYANGQGVYKVKIRSKVYENIDSEMTVTVNSDDAEKDIGNIVLVPRTAPEWITNRSESSAASLLQGLRIRLGADVFDASSMGENAEFDDAGYTQDGIPMTNYDYMASLGDSVINAAIGSVAGQVTGALSSWLGGLVGGIGGSIIEAIANAGLGAIVGMIPSADNTSAYVDANGKPIFAPWTNYVTGFEGGRTDRSDSVVYIEAWVSASIINQVFAFVNDLLSDYCGYGSLSEDRRYTAADLCALNPTKDDDVEMLQIVGTFNENNDEQIYDYVFENEADYINANYAFGGRMAGSIVSFALNWALGSLLGMDMSAGTQTTVIGLIQMFAYSLDFLIDILDQATRLLSHLLPFTFPYSMIMEKDLPGSPLMQTEVYSTMWEDTSAYYQYLTNEKDTAGGVLTGNYDTWVPSLQGNTYNRKGESGGAISTITATADQLNSDDFTIGNLIGQRATDVQDLIANEGILAMGENVVGYNYVEGYGTYNVAGYDYNTGYGVYGADGTFAFETTVEENMTVKNDPEIDDDGNLLRGVMRELDFIDKSVYAKVTLNNNVDTLLDRIILFINGASYRNATTGAMLTTDDYMPAATELRADTILYGENGLPLNDKYAAVESMIKEWIATNITNSYVIISDYQYLTDEQGVTTRKLIGKTYVRDVYGHFDDEDFLYGDISWIMTDVPETGDDGYEGDGTYGYVSRYALDENGVPIKDYNSEAYPTTSAGGAELGIASYAKAMDIISAKDDRFMELDISNNGIRLRAAQNFSELYYATGAGTAGMNTVSMAPPDQIVFHDPYNSLDFTAIGGTWANEKGFNGIRRNFDATTGTYTVQSLNEILPNRAKVNFSDGNSDDSKGVYVYWDLGMISFVPGEGEEVSGYIRGYLANLDVVSIPVTIQSSVMLTSDDFADVMPEIDPMDFNEEEYIKLLPEKWDQVFTLNYSENADGSYNTFTRRYIFNKLTWDIDESTIGMNGNDATAYLTYSFEATTPLDASLAAGASSEEVTIPVSIKVRDLDVVSVERLSSKQHMVLTYNGADMLIRLAEDALTAEGSQDFDADYVIEHATELSTDAATVLGYADRYTDLIEYTGVYESVTVYDANDEDALYIVYSGVNYDEFSAYATAYDELGLEASANTTEYYFAEGYLADHEFLQGQADADGNVPDGTIGEDNVIVINPFDVVDLYEYFATLRWMDAEIEGSNLTEGTEVIESWHIDAVNAESLANVDLSAIEHDDYIVTLTVSDSLGNTKDVAITVRIRPRYITTDLKDQVIGAGSNVITPFDDNARAVATAMVYEGGALVIAMYRPGTAPDAELNRDVAISHADTGLNVWPAELVREYGAFTAYSGRVDRISSYTADNALYIVLDGVDYDAANDYFAVLRSGGMMGIITENTDGQSLVAEGRINEFGLPSKLVVDYGDPVTGEPYLTGEELIEGVDFVWVPDDAAKLRYDYSDAGTWDYVWTARVGQGANTQDLTVRYVINTRIPTSVENIVVYPYSEYTEGSGDDAVTEQGARLGNETGVRFSNGKETLAAQDAAVYYVIPDSWKGNVSGDTVIIDGVEYMTNVTFNDPVFNGSFYYMTVLVYDETFGYIGFDNVRVTLLKSTIDALNVPWDTDDAFNTYGATAAINSYLTAAGDKQSAITATVYEAGNITIKYGAFAILGWSYSTGSAFKPTYSFSGDDVPEIIVTIGNAAANGNAAGSIWSQKVPLNIPENMFKPAVITGLTEQSGDGYKITVDDSGKATFTIADPYGFAMPGAFTVQYASGETERLNRTAFRIEAGNNFYSQETSAGTITFGSAENRQVVNVTFVNGAARGTVAEVKYFKTEAEARAATNDTADFFADFAPYAFDTYTLPTYARILWKGADKYEDNVYRVQWTSVTNYGTAGGNITAQARLGNGQIFNGYVTDTVRYTVIGETITDYVINSDVTIDPYAKGGNINTTLRNEVLGQGITKLTVTTDKREKVTLNITFNTISMDKDENGGILGSVISTAANAGVTFTPYSGKSINVRQALPIRVTIQERIAVGIRTWHANEFGSLTASIYDKLDFASLTVMNVVAIGRGDNLTSAINGIEFFDGMTEMNAAWLLTGEYSAALREFEVAFDISSAARQIQRVFTDGNTVYVLYRGAAFDGTYDGRHHEFDVEAKSVTEDITILFNNGVEKTVSELGISIAYNSSVISYNFTGGIYNVPVTLSAGTSLAQTFTVPVTVRSANVEKIGLTADFELDDNSIIRIDTADRSITELVVDPYVGFGAPGELLPGNVLAYFTGYTNPIMLNVMWDYSEILAAMSVNGGEFTAANDNAAIAFVYVEENGEREAVQSVEINVKVLQRAFEALYVSRNSATVATETLTDVAPVDYVNYDREYALDGMTIVPYVDVFDQNFDSDTFSFFKSVALKIQTDEGEKYMYFNLSEENYEILDRNTNRPVNTSNMYTGRDILVRFEYGSNSETAASDARRTTAMNVTMPAMIYDSGVTEVHEIDVYGFEEGTLQSHNEIADVIIGSETAEGEIETGALITTENGMTFLTDVLYDHSNALVTRTGEVIDYRGGTALITATIGNEMYGYQEITITLNYLDRTIEKLFDADNVYSYATYADGREGLHFEFDPFLEYVPENIFPATGDAVTFADGENAGKFQSYWAPEASEGTEGTEGTEGGDSANALPDGFPEKTLMVTWNDDRVALTYSGSDAAYVTVTISLPDGSYAQTTTYGFTVYDRTVTGFTDLLLEGKYDENGDIIPVKPYDYLNAEDLSTAIAADYLAGAGKTFRVEFGNIARNPDSFALQFTIGAKANNFKVAEGYDFEAELRAALSAGGEENMAMRFVLDDARGISYRGKDARFYLAIPGFALGEDGEQLARQDLPVAEQYIIGAEYLTETGDYVDYLNWLMGNGETAGQDGIPTLNNTKYDGQNYYYDSYNVFSPYHYIERGGMLLPEYAKIYVGTVQQSAYEDFIAANPGMNVTYDEWRYNLTYRNNAEYGTSLDAYEIELTWTNMVNGRRRISVYDEMVTASFQVDLDSQSYALKFFIEPGWILDDNVIIREAGRSYSEDEIIMLSNAMAQPVRDGAAQSVVIIDSQSLQGVPIYDRYIVTFAADKTYTFNNVTGGGSYTNDYMKWNFDTVNWSANGLQRATITLGGRGGQQVLWEFLTDSNKYVVNTTLPTMVAVQNGSTVNLPFTFKQYFAGSGLGSTVIPIDYNTVGMGDYAFGFYTDRITNPIGFTAGISTGTGVTEMVVSGQHLTPGYRYDNSEYLGGQKFDTEELKQQALWALPDTPYYPGYLSWQVTSSRAYPKEVPSGRIIVCVYQDPATNNMPPENSPGKNTNLQDYGITLHNPDAIYSFSELRPMLTNYGYPNGLPENVSEMVMYTETETMKEYIIPDTDYKVTYNSGTWSQRRIPAIQIVRGSTFDLRGLPMMSVRRERNFDRSDGGFFGKGTVIKGVSYDLMYLIPWQNATVRRINNRYSSSGNTGTVVPNGVYGIDTSLSTQTRYVITTTAFNGIPITVYLDIVSSVD